MSSENAAGYAGDVLAAEAYRVLSSDETSVLIDVRTQAEWGYVGVPDLSALGKTPLFLEWQSFPTMQVDPDFAARLTTLPRGRRRRAGRARCFSFAGPAPARDTRRPP